MPNIISKILIGFKEYIPKSFICFQEGYHSKTFYHDLVAGICVGVIAIPLALAFAIASGVSPEKGLFTAIIAGFLISFLGGSRVQIGGPTGAFVVIVYSIVSRFGYEGLALATFIAACLMIFMGLARFGLLLKFIPQPVIVGFTTGIALVIFSSQIKDFFGLQISSLPPEFLEKCVVYARNFHTVTFSAFLVALSSLLCIFLLKRFFPRAPAAMIVIVLATLISSLFHLPIETIGSKFGKMTQVLPRFSVPYFSWDLFFAVFPSALTVAFLGAIESLLSASVADGITGYKHRSNCELIAQGFANLGSILFGGIPATGAIARTTANINMGARTPVSGMIHAVTILLFMLFLAPLVGKIPLAALASILIFVAWNMSELPHFIEILKGQKGDALTLLITFILTVLMDLTVAVQVGVLVSAMVFLKRMTDRTTLENQSKISQLDEHPIVRETIPSEIAVFELNGPFFYSVSHLLDEALIQLRTPPKAFVLCLHKTPLIDSTAQRAIKQFSLKCRQKNIAFLIAGARDDLLRKSHLEEYVGKQHILPTIDSALSVAKKYLN